MSRSPPGERSGRRNHRRRIPSTAAAAFLAELDDKLHGHYAQAWETLYPPHQTIAPKGVYSRCESSMPFPATMRGIRITHVRAVAVHVAGAKTPVPGVAIRVRVTLAWYGPRDPIIVEHVFHLVAANSRWTWLLSPSEYEMHREGTCDGTGTGAAVPEAGRARRP